MPFILAILHMYLMPFGDPSHIHTYILSKPKHVKSELGSYQMYIYCVLYCLLKPFTVKQIDWGAVWHISTKYRKSLLQFYSSQCEHVHAHNKHYIYQFGSNTKECVCVMIANMMMHSPVSSYYTLSMGSRAVKYAIRH